MSYYAKFESHSGQVFRLDTRIYLQELPANNFDGQCVAAVVGKNPGSAKSSSLGKWGKLELKGDKLLPTVRKIFLTAYLKAGKQIPDQAFVQIWNLFYLCNNNLKEAIHSLQGIGRHPVCSTEYQNPNIVWFVWGDNLDQRLDSFKQRFQKRKYLRAFFYDKRQENISSSVPSASSFARHTQGLLRQPIIDHLANIL